MPGDRSRNLHRAIQFDEEALSVFTSKQYPDCFAPIMLDIASTLADIPDGDHASNLQYAISCAKTALTVNGEEKSPALKLAGGELAQRPQEGV